MNILFLSPGGGADYQCDSLFLGLRSLYGPSVVDHQRLDYLYADYGDTSNLYGRGFSLYGLLPSDADVDRTNIEERIAAHQFDLIVYGSIQRYQHGLDYVRRFYRRHEILFIDGEDQSHLLLALADHGLYFKRELYREHLNVYPIHLAIPGAKIGLYRDLPKTQVRASIDPRDRSTYIYTSEEDYYRDYARSLFAITMRKGGWDCLRHYEIWANRCIPIFLDLDQCPPTALQHLPKAELLEALALMDLDGRYWDTDEGHARWTSLWRRIHLKFAFHSTTERLAQYVIETAQQAAQIATAGVTA